jgi:hypothetical protein
MTEQSRRIEISWVQAVASALAAVSTAVLLSTVGVAGTIIGAALGSVAATVGSAVYSHYLAASRDRVAAAAAARARVRRAQAGLGAAAADLAVGSPRAEDRLDRADHDLQDAEITLDTTERTSPWREAFRGLPWRRLALAAAALFVVAMAAIVTFELVAGRAVSTYTGGSDPNGPRVSVPGVGGGDTKQPQPTPTPTPGPTPTELPSSVSTTSTTPTAPSSSPSASVSETPPASVSPSPSAPTASPVEPASPGAS